MNEVNEQKSTGDFVGKGSSNSEASTRYSVINLEGCQHILRAQLSGAVVLPHGLGLNQEAYPILIKALHDEDLIQQEMKWHTEDRRLIRACAESCRELFSKREDERQALIKLLCRYRNLQDPSSEQMAIIIATASLSTFHLWESLGLPERSVFVGLMHYNFPELYALNTQNMRWKRFFYHMLCEQGGDNIYKTPSCDACDSYAECFA
ncbi:MAG: nitrogen fixation protein NifQ [Pontiella sp.]